MTDFGYETRTTQTTDLPLYGQMTRLHFEYGDRAVTLEVANGEQPELVRLLVAQWHQTVEGLVVR